MITISNQNNESSNAIDEILRIGGILRRIETLVSHLKGPSFLATSRDAIVPLPGTAQYFNWLTVLLENRTRLNQFLQHWLRGFASSEGGSSIRRIRTIAAHLSAPPFVIDVS